MRSWLTWWFRFFTRIARYLRDLPLIIRAFRHRKRWSPPPHVWGKVDSIQGFMGLPECGLLYHAARHWPVVGPVIELGSFRGRSTTLLALAGRQVHAVDAWSPDNYVPSALGVYFAPSDQALGDFRSNIRQAGVEASISVHRGLTTDVAQGWQTKCAVLFIDAGHTYPDVSADMAAWLPHLLPEGLLLLHDTFSDRYSGVIQAAGELLRGEWDVVGSSGTIVALARKPAARQVTPAHLGMH